MHPHAGVGPESPVGTGNFGITSLLTHGVRRCAWDKMFGTYYASAVERSKSPTVFKLGYTPEVVEHV